MERAQQLTEDELALLIKQRLGREARDDCTSRGGMAGKVWLTARDA